LTSGPRAEAAPAEAAARAAGEVALSAVICTCDRYELLAGAVESLLGQRIAGGDIEIIVVDNSRNPLGAAEFGRRYTDTPDLRYLIEPRSGLSHARNRAAQAARGRVVAFIDDDARARPGWAQALLAAYDGHGGRAGVVGGRVVPRWPGEPPAWLDPSLLGYLSIVDLGDAIRELSPHEWLAGCNISFTRAALLSAGGFSTDLGRTATALLSNEELEATDRMREAGWLAVYAPDAVVEHLIAPERLTPEWFRRRAAWQAVSDALRPGADRSELAAAAEARLDALRRGRPSPRRENGGSLKREVDVVYNSIALALSAGEPPGTIRAPPLGERVRTALRSLLSR